MKLWFARDHGWALAQVSCFCCVSVQLTATRTIWASEKRMLCLLFGSSDFMDGLRPLYLFASKDLETVLSENNQKRRSIIHSADLGSVDLRSGNYEGHRRHLNSETRTSRYLSVSRVGKKYMR